MDVPDFGEGLRRTGRASDIPPEYLELKRYNFQHRRRGQCVIISNYRFATGLMPLTGASNDEEGITRVFRSLGFEVSSHHQLTIEKMESTLKQVAAQDHSDTDCLVCVIMTHGEDQGMIYGMDGKLTSLDAFVSLFNGENCPSLSGKPKLFFVQACRGEKDDPGAEVADDVVDAVAQSKPSPRIPIEADIFQAFSAPPGYFAWMHPLAGAWFMQALIGVLQKHGSQLELLEIMTMVNQVVAYHNVTSDGKFKQMPCFVSTLTKKLYFEPKPKP